MINVQSAILAFDTAPLGNLGSFVSGVVALALGLVALVSGSAGLKDWRAKQRQQKALADEQTNDIRLARRRVLDGWTPGGVEVYGVALLTEPDEMGQAVKNLTAGGPSEYVLLRVAEGGSNVNRAHSLRNLIKNSGYIARAPEKGEYEALEAGRRVLRQADGSGSR
jgi:hypothetical protein